MRHRTRRSPDGPDRDALNKDEQRRWELTLDHWALPIREVDPHAE